MRSFLFMIALAGCDNLWSLQPVRDVIPDVPVDEAVDAPRSAQGCADATREGFVDLPAFPALAACSGAWSIAGLRPDPPVSCTRAAGNDGTLPGGVGCTASDLCAAGWHVCRTHVEVYDRLQSSDRTCALLGADENALFVTAQSGNGATCDGTGTNDVYGCGTEGLAAPAACSPLDRVTYDMCMNLKSVGGWECPNAGSEVTTIRKSDPTVGGGVLCCRDAI